MNSDELFIDFHNRSVTNKADGLSVCFLPGFCRPWTSLGMVFMLSFDASKTYEISRIQPQLLEHILGVLYDVSNLLTDTIWLGCLNVALEVGLTCGSNYVLHVWGTDRSDKTCCQRDWVILCHFDVLVQARHLPCFGSNLKPSRRLCWKPKTNQMLSKIKHKPINSCNSSSCNSSSCNSSSRCSSNRCSSNSSSRCSNSSKCNINNSCSNSSKCNTNSRCSSNSRCNINSRCNTSSRCSSSISTLVLLQMAVPSCFLMFVLQRLKRHQYDTVEPWRHHANTPYLSNFKPYQPVNWAVVRIPVGWCYTMWGPPSDVNVGLDSPQEYYSSWFVYHKHP